MSGLGDLFGGLSDVLGGIFSDSAAEEAAVGFAELLSPEGTRRGGAFVPLTYERYLCGAPRRLNVNDR